MRRLILLSLFLPLLAFARARTSGYCSQGGQPVVTSGINSTTKVQASYPQCTVTVYASGTLTLATIYSNNSGTVQSNPFTASTTGYWFYYADDGTYDVKMSGAGIGSPFTWGALTSLDPASIPSLSNAVTLSGVQTITGQKTFNAPMIFNNQTFLNGDIGGPHIQNVGVGDSPTFNIGTLNTISSAIANVPTSATTTGRGGYIQFPPVLYNPYDSPVTCFDEYGNVVTQPLPPPGMPAFGVHDVVMWNSTSPVMPSNGSCGVPLNIDLDYGLNVNTYFYARGGLATEQPYYNSIQSLKGGVIANSFTAAQFYPAGTVTTTGPLAVGAYLGGHVDTGHSIGPPANGTIATVTNPFSGFEGLVAGQIYYDDALHCEAVYSGTAWSCIGSGIVTTPGGVSSNVQFNASGAFSGSSNFTWDNTAHILQINGGAGQGVISPLFNAYAGSTNVEYQGSNFSVTGQGKVATNGWLDFGERTAPSGSAGHAILYANSSTHQLLLSLNGGGFTAVGSGVAGSDSQVQFNNSGAFGASSNFTWNAGASVLAITGGTVNSGYQAPAFSSSNAGSSIGFTNSTGSFTITGAGNAAFQSLALTNGFTANGLFYGANTMILSGGGVLTGYAGPLFNATNTGANNAFQTQAGTMSITGAGNVAAQNYVAHSVFNSQADVNGGNAFQTSGGTMTITGAGAAAFQSMTANSSLITGTASGASMPLKIQDTGGTGTAGWNILNQAGSRLVTVSSGATAALSVLSFFNTNPLNVLQNGLIQLPLITTGSGGQPVCVDASNQLYKGTAGAC